MDRILYTVADRDRFKSDLDAIKLPCSVNVTEGVGRSDQQNRALFGVAYPPLMKHMGLRGEREKDELHEYFCGEYFGWHQYEILGKRKQRPLRTTTTDESGKRNLISISQMQDFYAFVQHRAADNGVQIPDPSPDYWMDHAA